MYDKILHDRNLQLGRNFCSLMISARTLIHSEIVQHVFFSTKIRWKVSLECDLVSILCRNFTWPPVIIWSALLHSCFLTFLKTLRFDSYSFYLFSWMYTPTPLILPFSNCIKPTRFSFNVSEPNDSVNYNKNSFYAFSKLLGQASTYYLYIQTSSP